MKQLFFFLLVSTTCMGQRIPLPVGTGHATGPAYATFNPTYMGSCTLSGGNLVYNADASAQIALATVGSSTTGKSTGKWYWEITITGSAGNATSVGVHSGLSPTSFAGQLGNSSNGYAYYSTSGGWWATGSLSFNACGSAYWSVLSNVIGVALDAGGNQVSIYLNGSLQCTQSISGGNYFPGVSSVGGEQLTANFGASAFAYTVPSGYNAGYY
jgi:SPRY domain